MDHGLSSPIAVILAAGHGKRMRSELLKVLHPVAGRPMVEHVLRAAEAAGIARRIVVIGHQGERVRAVLGDRVEYAWQSDQRGTGHAVMAASDLLRGVEGDVVVLYGDNPLLDGETIRDLLAEHRRAGADATALTAVMPNPSGLGRIVRDGAGRFVRVVEEKDATPAEREIREVMSGVFCFRLPGLLEQLGRLTPDNAQGELYLPDVFERWQEAGGRVAIHVASDHRVVIGPNTRRGLAEAEAVMRDRVLERLMEQGVTVVDPASTWVQDPVEVGQDTVLEPFTFLWGHTRIGRRCRIGPGARIVDSVVGDDVTVDLSVLEESEIGEGARVGPFAHLRPGTRVGPRAEIGNFVETKQAVLGEGVKAHHHSYLGDVTIGDRSNIGAGVVTVNYDGVRKHRTEIGTGAFVGCNANLVAPVSIGAGSYVAAGSTVNQDVPPDSLAIARARQVNKEGYARRLLGRRERSPRSPKE